MGYSTILVKESIGGITITFNRLEQQNSINDCLLKEINEVLDLAEKDSNCRIVVFEGQKGVFCTGMDFGEVSELESQKVVRQEDRYYKEEEEYEEEAEESLSNPFMETIRRFSLMPKVIISVVDGRAMAGGIGIIAASDLVIATPRSQFSLSEALWGLLPAMVTPYLIRRVGFQTAYRMTLTTMPISVQEAYEAHLVDEISENPHESVRRFWLRLSKLEESTIQNMKRYFRKMWLITEKMEEVAVREITRLSSHPEVIRNIVNYVKHQKLPWDDE